MHLYIWLLVVGIQPGGLVLLYSDGWTGGGGGGEQTQEFQWSKHDSSPPTAFCSDWSLLFQPQWGWVLARRSRKTTLPSTSRGHQRYGQPEDQCSARETSEVPTSGEQQLLHGGDRDGVQASHHLPLQGWPPAPPGGQQQELHWGGPVVQQRETLQGMLCGTLGRWQSGSIGRHSYHLQ